MAAETTVPVASDQGNRELATTREESRYLIPSVDIFETATALAVVADLPAVSKETLDVRVDDNVLTIRGKVNWNPQAEYLVKEFELHDFYRQFKLTDEVDQEQITAGMKDGVLTIQLPIRTALKPRQIEVNVH
jgi:HSP20 family molecular chaperone IbpA